MSKPKEGRFAFSDEKHKNYPHLTRNCTKSTVRGPEIVRSDVAISNKINIFLGYLICKGFVQCITKDRSRTGRQFRGRVSPCRRCRLAALHVSRHQSEVLVGPLEITNVME